MEKSKKFCVFCGERPSDKNLEHIIPRWLIETTGDPNRQASFGVNWLTGENRKFAFDQFQFPACSACNKSFSDLESKAKLVVLKILGGQPLEVTEAHIFLDWLDKVRVGLWLAFHYLDKNLLGIRPQFHIAKRIGTKDRCVLIYKIDDINTCLNFHGTNLPAFQHSPSAFLLVINNFYFFNISYDFLFSSRIGFPYPESLSLASMGEDKNMKVSGNLVKGFERSKHPLIRKQFIEPSLALYQPIFSEEVREGSEALYDTPFVRQHSADFEKGQGKVFIEDSNSVRPLSIGDQILPNSITYSRKFLENAAAVQLLEFQNALLTDHAADVSKLSKDLQRGVRNMRNGLLKTNNILIKKFKKKATD